MDEPAFDPEQLLAVLARHQVRFVVIGGLAAVLHGAPYLTVDCDITPALDPANLDRLSDALTELGARIWLGDEQPLPFEHDGRSLADAAVWNLVTIHGLLDVTMVPAGTEGFDDLARHALVIDVNGLQLAIASLADVIRSKTAANRDKDARVLPLLRRMLAEYRDRPDRG